MKVFGEAAILAGFGGVAIGLADYAVCNKKNHLHASASAGVAST